MLCQKCGKQTPNDARICAYCGAPLISPQRAPGQPQYTQPLPKKKNRGCLIAVLSVVAFLFLIIIILLAGSGGKDKDGETKTAQPGESAAVNAAKPEREEGKLGDFNVTIKDSVVVENDGKNILIVTYSFTNNSDDSKAFMYAIEDKLFQNGVELGTVYTSWGIEEHYNFDNKSKEIRPGVTLDVQEAYELNDPASEVEAELSESFSFADDKLIYKIKISE